MSTTSDDESDDGDASVDDADGSKETGGAASAGDVVDDRAPDGARDQGESDLDGSDEAEGGR